MNAQGQRLVSRTDGRPDKTSPFCDQLYSPQPALLVQKPPGFDFDLLAGVLVIKFVFRDRFLQSLFLTANGQKVKEPADDARGVALLRFITQSQSNLITIHITKQSEVRVRQAQRRNGWQFWTWR